VWFGGWHDGEEGEGTEILQRELMRREGQEKTEEEEEAKGAEVF
jgi:hypothetical protein